MSILIDQIKLISKFYKQVNLNILSLDNYPVDSIQWVDGKMFWKAIKRDLQGMPKVLSRNFRVESTSFDIKVRKLAR